MAQKPPSSLVVASEGHHENEPGTAVVATGGVANPGLEPEHQRITDLDPKEEKKA